MTRLIGFLLAMIFATGCATPSVAPIVPELATLVAVPPPAKSFIFPRSVATFIKSTSMMAADVEDTTIAGEYVATHENELGTFFQAAHYVVGARFRPSGPYNAYRGGFWIPKSHGVRPRVYVFAAAPDSIEDINFVAGHCLGTHAVIANTLVTAPRVSPVVGGLGAGIAAAIIAMSADKHPPRVFVNISNPEVLELLNHALLELK